MSYYHLTANAIIVKTNINKEKLRQNIQKFYGENKQRLIVLRFDDDKKEKGFISNLKNAHLWRDEMRIQNERCDIILHDNYLIVFTAHVSYVSQAMKALQEAIEGFEYEILKHPIAQEEQVEEIKEFVKNNLKYDRLIEVEVGIIGLKLLLEKNDKKSLIKYFVNGTITYGMFKSEEEIMDTLKFIIKLDNHLTKDKE